MTDYWIQYVMWYLRSNQVNATLNLQSNDQFQREMIDQNDESINFTMRYLMHDIFHTLFCNITMLL